MPDRLMELETSLRDLIRRESFAAAQPALAEYARELETRLRATAPGSKEAELLMNGARDLLAWARYSALVSRQYAAAELAHLDSVSRYVVPGEPAARADIQA